MSEKHVNISAAAMATVDTHSASVTRVTLALIAVNRISLKDL
jgi:hypothetical protein